MICYSKGGHLIESKSKLTEQNSLFLNFTPEVQYSKKKDPKLSTSYRVNGVNILNRKNLDTKTIIERYQKRRENHNHIEKRRRSTMNEIILQLSKTVPGAFSGKQKPNKTNILKQSLAHILELQAQNRAIKQQLEYHSLSQNYEGFPHNHTNPNVIQPDLLSQQPIGIQTKSNHLGNYLHSTIPSTSTFNSQTPFIYHQGLPQ